MTEKKSESCIFNGCLIQLLSLSIHSHLKFLCKFNEKKKEKKRKNLRFTIFKITILTA